MNNPYDYTTAYKAWERWEDEQQKKESELRGDLKRLDMVDEANKYRAAHKKLPAPLRHVNEV